MKIFCISYHLGALSHAKALFEDLGHEIHLHYAYPDIPYTIPEYLAEMLWQQNKEKWNTYDLILTADTAALSYIFLRKLDEMKPKLVIWIMNTFDYLMKNEYDYIELFRNVSKDEKYINKVKMVPYTDYEKIYCARQDIYLREPVLLPYGKEIRTIAHPILSSKTQDFSGMIKSKSETYFVSDYYNDKEFAQLGNILKSAGISVVCGQFDGLDDLKQYRGLIHMPDAFSKFFAYELLVNNIPVFIPTEDMFLRLIHNFSYGRANPQYRFIIDGGYGICPKEYVNFCVWYSSYPLARKYFTCFEDLISKLHNFNNAEREQMIKTIQKYAILHLSHVRDIATQILD